MQMPARSPGRDGGDRRDARPPHRRARAARASGRRARRWRRAGTASRWGKPLTRTREYVDIVRTILRREEPLEHHGEHYDIPYTGDGATGLGKPLKLITKPLRPRCRSTSPRSARATSRSRRRSRTAGCRSCSRRSASPRCTARISRRGSRGGAAGPTASTWRRSCRSSSPTTSASPATSCGRWWRSTSAAWEPAARTSTTGLRAGTGSRRRRRGSRISSSTGRRTRRAPRCPTRWWTRSRSWATARGSPTGSAPGASAARRACCSRRGSPRRCAARRARHVRDALARALGTEVVDARLLAGGASKEAWAVDTADGRELLVRRALGGVIHVDTLPLRDEFEMLVAAREAGVRVPEPVAYLGEVDGREAFAMERVSGETIGRRIVKSPPPGLGLQMAEELARIHAHPAPSACRSCPRPDLFGRLLEELDAVGEPHPAIEYGLAWCRQRLPLERPPGRLARRLPHRQPRRRRATGSWPCSTGSSRSSATRWRISPGRWSARGASAPTSAASAGSATSSRTSRATRS